jgi:hypothetical protein
MHCVTYKEFVSMAETSLSQISKKTWYRWSLYVNILLFFIVGMFITLLLIDSYNAGIIHNNSMELANAWVLIVRDVAFLSVALALVFFQFFRNQMMIIRRSL